MALPVSNLRTIITDGTNEAAVNDHGHLSTYSPSEVLTGNSTATPLLADAVFPGASVDVLEFAVIQLNVYADVASATDGLSVQFSSDGTNWDHTDVYTVPAANGKVYSFQPAAQYMRVQYTNGTGAQSAFRLQTIGTHVNIKPSSHRIQDAIVDEDDAELVLAVITAQKDGDGFDNLTSTADGNLKVANVEDGLSIAKGDVTGSTFIHKFGNAPDFDQGDGQVTIWDGAEDATAWELMRYVYSTTADIDSISSSDNGDTQDIVVEGLDTNSNEVVQTVTLTGQTRVALSTSLRRVYRAYNDNSVDLTGHVFVYVNGATTGGVPDTNADIRAVIDPVNQQTEMAVYTVPAGKTGYVRDWYGSTAGANKNSNFIVKLTARIDGKVWRVKHTNSLSDNGTSAYQHVYQEPEVFPAKTDLEMTVEMLSSGATAASFSGGFDIVLVDN
jgi:hypothetical protein